jgi:putative DNA primase/helicase
MEEYTAVIKETTGVKTPIIEDILAPLAERPQWVNWRREMRDGKSTKVPYTPGTNRRASTTDLMTWGTLSEASLAYATGDPPYDGIGFVFSSADPYVGIDLDDCRNPETGEISPWAQKIISRVLSVSRIPMPFLIEFITASRKYARRGSPYPGLGFGP